MYCIALRYTYCFIFGRKHALHSHLSKGMGICFNTSLNNLENGKTSNQIIFSNVPFAIFLLKKKHTPKALLFFTVCFIQYVGY